MRAMILAAGRGERMRPLTDSTPKPLLMAGGKPLIVWHIERLVRAEIRDIVINHAWLGPKIEAALGDGSRFGARIRYSPEPTALETAGGIAHALHHFEGQPFLVMNGDVWCDWDPASARDSAQAMRTAGALGWLLLADNPEHHPRGDFILDRNGRVHRPVHENTGASIGGHTLTYTGIAVYDPALFGNVDPDRPARLAPLLTGAIERGALIGNRHPGTWIDVGTPARLQSLDRQLAAG